MRRTGRDNCVLQRLSFWPKPFYALILLITAILALAVPPIDPTQAAEFEFSKPFNNRLNPTNHVLTMLVPLKDGETVLGDVMISINPDDSILINKKDLQARLQDTLGDKALARLKGIDASNGFVAISTLASSGVNLRFDRGLQELQVSLPTEERPIGDISFANRQGQLASAALAKPAKVSGYLNVIAGLDELWTHALGAPADTTTSARFDFESAIRFNEIVLENRAVYDGQVDSTICPTGASCIYGHTPGLKRQSSRLVYDWPDSKVRLEIGDTDALASTMQRSFEMAGLSLEKSLQKLSPAESSAASGQTVLRLERPSEIDVVVNGATVQHLHLRPGTYNLRDLPLATGANQIKLVIVDDTGVRREQTFTTFSASNLLGAGKNEWAVSAGVPSYLRDNERIYVGNGDYAATSYLRYGLTDTITGEADAQADNRVVMAGVGAKTATSVGVFGLQGATSVGSLGTGFAADATWDLSNFGGLVAQSGESLHFGAEYRSSAFHRPGDTQAAATGILYPEFNYWLRLSGSYSTALGEGIGLTISGRYQFSDDQQAVLSPFTLKGDRYGTDVTLSRPLGPTASASLLMGYSNESYLRNDVSQLSDSKADFRVGLRFNIRPDDRTTVSTNYDSLNRQTTVSAYHSEGNGIGRWDTTVDAQQLGYTDTLNSSAALGYYGNRGEAHLSYTSDLTNVGFNKFDPQAATQRAALRVGSSIAFADGTIAVGPPIRGGAFAIVSPHESIAGKDIIIGEADNIRAKADSWGPAVVPDLPAYAPSNLVVDVPDIPTGYSLGAGAYDFKANYRAGYDLEIGSAFSVSVYGTLIDGQGEPVGLTTGFAHPAEDPSRQVAIFTNANGKFGAEGLASGRWIIEMATDGQPLTFGLDVPKGVNGLFKAGTLKPIGVATP